MTRPSAALAVAIAAAMVLVLGLPSFSSASFLAGTTTTATIRAASDWTAPTVTVTDPGSTVTGTVTLAATASDAETGIASVTLQYLAPNASSWVDVCSRTAAPYTCAWSTTALPDGDYDLRAVATDNANYTAISETRRTTVRNTVSTVVMVDPGQYLRGSTTLSATPHSTAGISSVKIQRAPSDSANWVDVCVATEAPYRCSWDTGRVPDGLYDVRAVLVDSAGGTTVSNVVADRWVDNTSPSVGLEDPGSPLAGTVTLTASASDAASGVATVTVQYAPAGSGSWTDVCTTSSAPWSCSFDTTTVPAGSYDFRAVATDAAGNTGTSSPVVDRRVGVSLLTFGGIGPVSSRTSSGSLTVTYPSGTKPGDLVLLVQANAANQNITTPNEWSLLADQRTGSPQQFRFTVWWKVAGTEGSVPVAVNTNSSGSSVWAVRYLTPAGGGAPNPAHTVVRQGLSGATASLTPASDVAATGPATVISLAAVRAQNNLSLQSPGSFTFGENAVSTTGAGSSLVVADATAVAGANPASPTWSQDGTPAQWAWATVAFRTTP
jgi:hypothetical protein